MKHHVLQVSTENGTTELVAAIASLASTAATLSAQAQRVAELLAAEFGSSRDDLALLAKREAVMAPGKTGVETMEKKLTLTRDETANLLGVHPRTLSRMRASNEGPKPIKIRGAVRYRRHDVERWLEGKRS